MRENSLTKLLLSSRCVVGILLLCTLAVVGCTPLERLPVVQSSSANTPAATVHVEAATPNSVQLLVSYASGTDGLASADHAALIDISSPRGMGRAQIRFDNDLRPQPLTLRFHLAGLEQLRITTASVSLVASVSSTNPTSVIQEMTAVDGANGQTQAQSQDAGFESITSESPYWLAIQIQPSSAQTSAQTSAQENNPSAGEAIAVESIDVTIPATVVAEAGDEITIEWIDFYR